MPDKPKQPENQARELIAREIEAQRARLMPLDPRVVFAYNDAARIARGSVAATGFDRNCERIHEENRSWRDAIARACGRGPCARQSGHAGDCDY